jgi:hypothetical protein
VRAGRVLSPEEDPLVEPEDERPQSRHVHSAPMISRKAIGVIILSVGLAAVAMIGVAQFRAGTVPAPGPNTCLDVEERSLTNDVVFRATFPPLPPCCLPSARIPPRARWVSSCVVAPCREFL